MEDQLPGPDVVSLDFPIGQLTGTAKTIANLALGAGYTVKATYAIGPRIPRRAGDPIVRQVSVTVAGMMGRWRFMANVTDRDGWEVVLHRPGWPEQVCNTALLVATLKAQTPTDLGKAS